MYSETCLKQTLKGPSLLSYMFTLQKIRKEKLVLTEAGVRLMQGVCLIWGPLNTGFTVQSCDCVYSTLSIIWLSSVPVTPSIMDTSNSWTLPVVGYLL